MTTGQSEKPFETTYGSLLRLGDRREIAIYRRGTVWVADFQEGHGELFTPGEWFNLNGRVLIQAQRRNALDIVSPLPESVVARIELLHRPVPQASAGAAMRRHLSTIAGLLRRCGSRFAVGLRTQ